MFKPKKSKLYLFIFVVVYFVLGWFFVAAPYSQVNEVLSQAPKALNQEFLDQLPADFTVTVKNGQVSINQPSPYCLSLKNDQEKSGIIFDVSQAVTPNPKDLEANGHYQKLCRPVAIVGQEYILFPDKDAGYRLVKVSPEMNFSADKSTVKNLVDQYLPMFISFGRTAYFVGPFILAPFVYLFMLLLNTWYTIVAKFISKVFKIKTTITPDQVYNLTLFFYTIITAIDWVIFGYLIHDVAGITTINSNFFMRNTLIITLLTLYYQTSHPPKSESQSQPDSDPIQPPLLK